MSAPESVKKEDIFAEPVSAIPIGADARLSLETALKDFNQRQEDARKREKTLIPIGEARRRHGGKVTVRGMITSMSQLYKVIRKEGWTCNQCYNQVSIDYGEGRPASHAKKPEKCNGCRATRFTEAHEYANALRIQLKDTDEPDALQDLEAILYDEDTRHVRAGEIVTVTGDIMMAQKNKQGDLIPFINASSIAYEAREHIQPTERDIKAFKRFSTLPNLMARLVSMTAPNVIGQEPAKRGLLRSLVGSPEKGGRGRIHTLFVGDPGTAKTRLAREAAKLRPNGRYVTAQNASGKSLTAIVDKENDNTILRLGVIPLAKGSLCVINEIGLMHPADQNFLMDAMEEGRFTIDKYGVHADIDSPTTIIGTTNQMNATWSDATKVDRSEIPIKKVVLDRFDQVYVFRDTADKDQNAEYADKKVALDKKALRGNYAYLKKYIEYALTIDPVITPEAEVMLNQYWVQLKSQGLVGNRALDTLYRLARAQARLELKGVVDAGVARAVQEEYNLIHVHYGKAIAISADPRDTTVKSCWKMLQETKYPIAFDELLRTVAKDDEQVRRYIGDDLRLSRNYKLRSILELVLNNPAVKEVQKKPVVLQWVEEKQS